ncbi:MAG TPA: hypothetical protein VNF45_08080 [Candidatus Binataceae bacterium]|nr:hypothetical protein [Candidatus Binataceae bacterium]
MLSLKSNSDLLGCQRVAGWPPGRIAIVAAIAAAVALGLAGCGIASAPIKDRPLIVATPEAGQLTVATQPEAAIGDVQPVYVSIANGTDTPRSIIPSQIFAVDESGARVAPLPAGEAARQAGGAGELKAALTSAAVSGGAAGALGAGVGAAAGAFLGGVGTGAIFGGALGAGEGILSGVQAGSAKADTVADQQLTALALQGGDVRRDFTVSGYVFFPKGQYQDVELLMVNGETGDTESLREPWR